MGLFRVMDLKGFLDEINQEFDSIRIIEPVKRQVVYQEGDEDIICESTCYEFWDTGETCGDCTSQCIKVGEDTTLKIEHSDDRKIMVISSVFIYGDNKYILEIAQDITGTKEKLDPSVLEGVNI